MQTSLFLLIVEIAGTIAFAISGIRLAAAKNFDWFGAYVVGLVTAIGGGTLRDVLLGTTPFWMQNGIVPFAENNWNIPEWSDYLEHLVLFPLDAIWRFLPWTFLAWTPFCVAFQELDPTPIFSRFLRTLFIALFALLWLSPFTDPRDFLYLAPSLAILSGHNYYLLMCRYGGPLQKLLRPVPELIILAGGIILFFYLIPQRWIGEWFADLHYRTEFFPQLYGDVIDI